MPVHTGKDSKGCFIQWGGQKKYYYKCGDAAAQKKAETKAAKQGAAAHARGYKENAMKYVCECIKCGKVVKTNSHCADLKCSKCGGQMRRKERPGPGKNDMPIQKIVANFVGNTRYDEMSGKKYLVAPMVMLTEGVHEGSDGPLYYPKDELNKTPQVWNHKPVIVYHPQAAGGEGVSACDPIILSNRQVGLIMNARVGNVPVTVNGEKKKITALKAEAWLDEERMDKIDERIMQAIDKNEMMELSTGLFTDNEDESGDWNGEEYDAIARNYRPDHLALLPDLKGACSIEDGAGFLRLNAIPDKIDIVGNDMSHANIRSLLNSWLQDKEKGSNDYDAWVEDVYDDFFVFLKDGKLFKGVYAIVDDALQIVDSFEEVVRVTEYRTKDGKFVGNENSSIKRKETEMKKEKVVDALIKSNSNSWVEDDRDVLIEMEDDVLTKMIDSEKLAAEKAVENAVKEAAEEAKKNAEVEKKTAEKKAAEEKVAESTENKPKTVDEFIDDPKVPQAIRNVLRSGVATYNAITNALVKRLLDNAKNQFTEEQLRTKDNDELQRLVALTSDKDDEDEPTTNFEVLGLESNVNQEEPLVMPPIVG